MRSTRWAKAALLRRRPSTVSSMASGVTPRRSSSSPICMGRAGIATCFLGFSTFFARPLLNIHDFAILPQHRGRGLARHLLRAVEAKALELGCCTITLEVQEKNVRARRVYERAGFAQAGDRQATGGSLFS